MERISTQREGLAILWKMTLYFVEKVLSSAWAKEVNYGIYFKERTSAFFYVNFIEKNTTS
jgi:hypothetical protein